MRLAVAVLVVTLAAVGWFNFFQDSSAAAAAQRTADLLDSRPSRSILIVGNSRTYRNDMPALLREIADSAGSLTKFQVETSAYPAASFKTHWHNQRTMRLLAAGWDDIILQAESGAQMHPQYNADFHEYGAKLVGIAKLTEGGPRLLVGWAYDPERYSDRDYNAGDFGCSDHLAMIASEHAQLASDTAMRRINLAGLWEAVRRSHPSIRLTTDGNHPTLAGSYLYARLPCTSIYRMLRHATLPMCRISSILRRLKRCETRWTASRCLLAEGPTPVRAPIAAIAPPSLRRGP